MVYSFGVSDQEGPLSVVSVFYTQEGNDELRKKRISWIVSKLATAVSFHVKVASQLTPDSLYASSVVPLPPTPTHTCSLDGAGLLQRFSHPIAAQGTHFFLFLSLFRFFLVAQRLPWRIRGLSDHPE